MIESLLEALNQSPDNIPIRILLAEQLVKEGNFGEAESHYKHALGKDPSNKKIKRGLALTYLESKKFSPAIIILEELTSIENDLDLWLSLSRALLKNQEIDRAIDAYKKVLDINPAYKDEELDSLRNTQQATNINAQIIEIEMGFNEIEKPKINFEDVGGMADVKDEIKIKIIQPLQHPDLYRAYGKKVGGGILLFGPPGCGKTHLARATAGQIKAGFISVGIHDVLDMWMGNSERKLHDLFELARRQTPCVMFFDEIDALGSSRSDMRTSSSKMLINQFLTELDGVQSSNEGLLILGATNAPWHLDTAFRRPGRFDRIIFVPPPDIESRESILKVLMRGKPSKEIDFKTISKITADFSGADLQAVIDQAIEDKLRESFKDGKAQLLEESDLVKAVKKVKPSTKEWFVTARNYALYANESGLYDDILSYLKLKK
jgi:transitional endoplasmic reticulum ATPase